MSFLSFVTHLFAQPDVQRMEPPTWWVGMQNRQLQIMVYGKDIAQAKVSLNYPGVKLQESTRTKNPNYLFINLDISPKAKPGRLPLVLTQGAQSKTIDYLLEAKPTQAGHVRGFNPSDLIYLIMPDRFANGNPANDEIPGMLEKIDRKAPFGRHGGDLQGVIGKLDYLQDLGITALWLNPVLENDMPASSYHGYAITDFYNVDRRFGGNETYMRLIAECKKRGIKVIQDMVANHIGLHHWLMKDLPSPDWVNQFSEFTRSNYRLSTMSDPHASQNDTMLMEKGWFDTTMPDLNQANPLLATYLIQNSLWWFGYAGIDGIRMDTYPYPNKHFMAKWSEAVLTEFPTANIVGEVWTPSVPMAAYWTRHSRNRDGYTSAMPSVTDFPVYEALARAFNEPTGWNEGLTRIYNVLAEDFLYEKPEENVIFLDNHDLSRYFTTVKGDMNSMKMGLAFLLTARGVPQMYYGAEILMTGDGSFHPNVREDFPGGWPGDATNAFTAEGRTAAQNEAFNYLRKMAQWRKGKTVIHTGKLTHFIPENETYVYFRHTDKECVMVAFNTSTEAKTLNTKRFEECMKNYSTAKNVMSGEVLNKLQSIVLPPRSATILELQK